MPRNALVAKKLFLSESRGSRLLAKILIDQNIPKRVMDWLKQKGFEIVTLADASLRGASDKKIAAFAMQNNMAVLTQDIDFAKMYHTLYRRQLAVILVNTKEGTTQSIIQALDKAQLKAKPKKRSKPACNYH